MKNELILFETADKEIKLNVSVNDNTVWLNRNQLAELFERDVKTIGTKRISDGAMVAITLMIAESNPSEKDIMVNLVMNLLTI